MNSVLLSDVLVPYMDWLGTKQTYVWRPMDMGNEKVSSGEDALDALYSFTLQRLKEERLPFNGHYDGDFLNVAAEDVVRIYADDSKGRLGGGLSVVLHTSFSDDDKLGLFLDINFKKGALDVLRRNNRHDHVWQTLMGVAHMDDCDTSIAEKHFRIAYGQSPQCPFVLWNRSLFWVMHHKYMKPMRCLDRLLSMSNSEMAYGRHGEGARRAAKIKNDAVLLRAYCYAHIGDFSKAHSDVNHFLTNRRDKKIGSCFHKSQITYLVAFVNNAKTAVNWK